MRGDAIGAFPRIVPGRVRALSEVEDGWYNQNPDDAFIRDGRFSRKSDAPRRGYLELRCPYCKSTELRRVALLYQGGLARIQARSRLVGFVFGDRGPDLIVGRTTTRGTQQTEISRALKPPTKWSFLRLISRFAIFTFVALGAYIMFVASSTPPVPTLPLELLIALDPVAFLLLAFAVWRHNRLVYPSQYAQWERSFLCSRCGAPSLHNDAPFSLHQPQ
jgi:hypothetical protein